MQVGKKDMFEVQTYYTQPSKDWVFDETRRDTYVNPEWQVQKFGKRIETEDKLDELLMKNGFLSEAAKKKAMEEAEKKANDVVEDAELEDEAEEMENESDELKVSEVDDLDELDDLDDDEEIVLPSKKEDSTEELNDESNKEMLIGSENMFDEEDEDSDVSVSESVSVDTSEIPAESIESTSSENSNHSIKLSSLKIKTTVQPKADDGFTDYEDYEEEEF